MRSNEQKTQVVSFIYEHPVDIDEKKYASWDFKNNNCFFFALEWKKHTKLNWFIWFEFF